MLMNDAECERLWVRYWVCKLVCVCVCARAHRVIPALVEATLPGAQHPEAVRMQVHGLPRDDNDTHTHYAYVHKHGGS
jgi:hypothetical protein